MSEQEPLHVRFTDDKPAWTNEQIQRRLRLAWTCPYHHEHRAKWLAYPCCLLAWLRHLMEG